jgi:WD40 repeat protein
VAVISNSRYVICDSEECTLRVCDLATGKTEKTLQGHTESIHALAATPDGRYAVSGSRDCTLRLWDLATGQAIATFTADSGVYSCAIAPEGRTIVAGDELGGVHFLRFVEPEETKLLFSETKTPQASREQDRAATDFQI